MKSEFSTLDIVKALEIPRERLREWMNRGYIKPSIQQAKGQGTKALFTLEDVYLIGLFRYLIETGMKRGVAGVYINGRIVSGLKGDDPKSFSKSALVMLGVWDDGGSLLVGGEMVPIIMQNAFATVLEVGGPITKDEGELDHVIVVNFKRIRRIVDRGLRSLE